MKIPTFAIHYPIINKKIMKRIVLLMLVPFFMVACNQKVSNEKETATEDKLVEVSINDLLENAGDYVGKTVLISGTVDHVCKHGGKKMFVFGENPEDRIKITTGKNIGSFEVELEGSKVNVQGIVNELKVDENYLTMREQELEESDGYKGANELSDGKGHEGGMEENELEEQKKQNKQLREKLEASGQDHISFYSIECVKFEEKK